MAQRVGFKDYTYAPITADDSKTYTTGTPTKMMKVAKGKTQLKYDSKDTYLDDALDCTDHIYKEGDMEVEGDKLTAKIISDIYGHKDVNGVNVINKDDVAPDVAVMYRSKLSNGKYMFYCYYRVNFGAEEEEDLVTQGNDINRQNVKLKGKIKPRQKDGRIGIKVSEDDLSGDTSTILASWFTKVPEAEDIKGTEVIKGAE